MKRLLSPLLSGALAFALAGPLTASATPQDHARVLVSYENPMGFTDFKDRMFPTTTVVEGYMDEFRRVIQRLAPGFLPTGQQLEITFLDIDMAGDFEPQRGPDAQDVRIIRAIYPPRLTFTYVVRDADGVTVREGRETLTDLSFQNTMAMPRESTFLYEQELMRGWLRTLR
jgi:hypothetical protein